MEKLEIEIPEGHEIDKDKSTFECIVFKKIENKLPESWEELGSINGCYITNRGSISKCFKNAPIHNENKNVIPSKEEAEGLLALIQLLQLRDRYNGEWKPDWEDSEETKWIIENHRNTLNTDYYTSTPFVMHFKTEELRDHFFKHHKDLLEKAKMFL